MNLKAVLNSAYNSAKRMQVDPTFLHSNHFLFEAHASRETFIIYNYTERKETLLVCYAKEYDARLANRMLG